MSRGNTLVWRLLRRNISSGQIAGYALANLVGLAIVLTAIQFYRDITGVWGGEDSLITSDYLVISRKVSGLGGLGASPTAFSADDRSDLQKQPWAKRIGEFTPSRFNVNASLSMGGRGMSTYMFFEAIPDEFFDIKPARWGFNPQRPEIPIVLSRDYLALYNFGFAATRGLPQVSESMISMVPLKISISGNGREVTLPARIVGFSSRLNTIAVPQQFMDWANVEFGDEPAGDPSRLIVEVTDPGDPQIEQYLESHGYETAGDKLTSGKANHFFAIVTGVVVAVGAIISVLAFFILMLSIYLLIQKNRRKIHDLILLGYTPAQVGVYYYRLVTITNVAVLVAAVAVTLVGRALWAPALESLGAKTSSPLTSIIIGVSIIIVITAINILTIKRQIIKSIHPA